MGIDPLPGPQLGGGHAAEVGTERGKARLAVEVLAMYARVRWLVVRHGPVPAAGLLRSGLNRPGSPDSDRARVQVGRRLGRAVTKVLRLLPADDSCLMRSLVLTGLLARRGIYATVVIGVRSDPVFGAHAWVEVGASQLLPGDDLIYQRLAEV